MPFWCKNNKAQICNFLACDTSFGLMKIRVNSMPKQKLVVLIRKNLLWLRAYNTQFSYDTHLCVGGGGGARACAC